MEALLEICSKCDLPTRDVPAGVTLLEEGVPSQALFILRAGTVEIQKQDIELNRVDSPGSFFGEMSLFMKTPPMATVRTLEPSSFFVAEDGLAFLESNPEVNFHLATLLANRLNRVTNYLVDIQRQYASNDDHLGMVDEVLESLLHHQAKK